VAREVDPSDLSAGDEVLLSHEMNCLVGRSPHPVFLAGEIASFDRRMPDGRLVLSARDEEIVVDAAQALRDAAPQRGDLVRWDRATGLAYERIDRAEGPQCFLEEMPQDSFDDIGGLDAQIEELKRAVLVRFDPVLADLASRYGLNAKKAVLLWGPPGTGKTMIVRGLANHLGRLSPTGKARFINLKPGALNSMWFGQSEHQYREVFRVARAASELDPRIPTILYFDEVDAIGSARGHGVTRVDDKVLMAFMAELDGLEARGNVMVIASTNRLDALDPALVRPGRLGDCVIHVGAPDRKAARAILGKHLRPGIPYVGSDLAAARDEILDAVVARLYAANAGSEVASVTLRDSKRLAVKARDLVNGAVMAKIAQSAVERAYMREAAGGTGGVTLEDALRAADAEVSSLARALTPANCRLYLSTLPQDVDVVSVQPTTRNAADASRLMSHA
jgi:proteasome-associated ATPase